MSPFNMFYTWQTTSVTEILEQTESVIRFKTKNSEYKLEKDINNCSCNSGSLEQATCIHFTGKCSLDND